MAKRVSIRGNARRVDQILRVLVKYGLAEWLGAVQPDLLAKYMKGVDSESIGEMTREQQIRSAITELGTTFIKLGQILSTRADLVGPELADELSRLQSGTPADPPKVARETVESELGQPIEEIFVDFEPEAMASASIGQVHKASLPDGTAVVVKVQHPGIEEKITHDLEILGSLAELAEKHSAELRLYQPVKNIADFKKQLLFELDFGREARNLEQFNQNFGDDPRILAPRPHHECSTRRILTMDRLEGSSVAHAEELRATGVDTADIAERGADAYLDMIFRDRFYHADPHPGNLFVLPDKETIGFLDFGMIGRVDEVTLEKFEGLLGGQGTRRHLRHPGATATGDLRRQSRAPQARQGYQPRGLRHPRRSAVSGLRPTLDQRGSTHDRRVLDPRARRARGCGVSGPQAAAGDPQIRRPLRTTPIRIGRGSPWP